jgi:hypothetical protein
MAGQKKVNSNVEVKKEVVETKPVQVETKPVTTPAKKGGKATAAAPVVAAPEPAPKKGGKATKETTAPVVAAPVSESTGAKKGGKAAALVVAVPESTGAKKGGKATKETTAPVVAAPVSESTGPKKGGKATKETTATESTGPKKGGKATAPLKKAKVTKKVIEEDSQGEDDGKKHVRSFKVRLPGSEAFEGRFTGLTPYQAANKALSKYYRESNELQKEVTFSICESTRNSRKSTYTYVGGRHELSTPVTYTIADGRLITKKFKNILKKVKKVDEATVSQ